MSIQSNNVVNNRLGLLDNSTGIDKLLAVIQALRHPKTGCPWDLKQTHESLKPYVLEEAYEVVEAIQTGDMVLIKEELGDLLLQVVLHAQIAHERQDFDFQGVAQGISDKLIRRHPHVFGDTTVNSAEDVVQHWDAIKQAEKGLSNKPASVLEGVSLSQSALMRTADISHKAVKVGFRWPSDESLWDCVMSEFEEFKAETQQTPRDPKRLEDELGDILFAVVSLANHYGVNSEVALTQATTKFTRRFQQMEQQVIKPLTDLSFEEWDNLWKQAKQQTKS